jgi:peptidoglycan/LPS O-acetylase OafA/YrhL
MSHILDVRNPLQGPGIARSRQLSALTSLRFFAALHVCLFHMVRPFAQWGALANFMSVGYVGVSFFFLLSGFILTYSHAAEYELGRSDTMRFWAARLARLYPAYLLSMVAAAFIYHREFHPAYRVIAYVSQLLMVQSWSTRTVNMFHITVFFYLVFPFVLLRLRPTRTWQGVGVVVGFWLLAMVAPVLCLLFEPGSTYGGGIRTFMITRVPLFALPEFLAGISLGWLFLRFPPPARWSGYLAGAGIVGLVGVLLFSRHIPYPLLHNGLLIPLDALILIGLSQENWIARALAAPVLVLLGEASYALYLIHLMFHEWLIGLGFATDLRNAAWKLALLLTASVGLYWWVERPWRKRLLEAWTRRRADRVALLENKAA